MRIKIVCSECGSDDVCRDAWAVGDVESQTWDLGPVFDQGFCQACDCERSLDEVALAVDELRSMGGAAEA
jgi:hypothetical protein